MKSRCVCLFAQGGYPAKLKKVLIVTAPLWFKAPFKILRLFVREKLRDRVYTVSIPQVSVTRESIFAAQELIFIYVVVHDLIGPSVYSR